jgi:hypothetical protein
MNRPSGDPASPLSRLRLAAVLLFVAVNLSVFIVRIVSVLRYGQCFDLGGGDSLMAYSIWKGMHGLRYYEWPFRFPFNLTLYNYLFYETYAFALKLAGIWDAEILSRGRALTSLFAMGGAVAQWRLVQHRLRLKGARALLSLLLAVGLWLCTSLVGYWAMSLRPDMAAVALVMVALWVVVARPRFGFAVAGVLFYLAWSFKQSTVLTLASVCLFLLIQKRWRDVSVLAAVFAALTAATLVLGTPEYRFSVLVAPGLVTGFSLNDAWQGVKLALAENIYWLWAPFAVLLASGSRRSDETARLLATTFALSLVGGFLAMSKAGAGINYLFESFAAGSTLLQLAVFTLPGRWLEATLLFGCVQPLGALHPVTLPGGRQIFKPAQIATRSEYEDAARLRGRLEELNHPLFTTDAPFMLPWVSTGNSAPALCVDEGLHYANQPRFENGGVEGMLERGEIPSVMIRPRDGAYLKRMNPGYEPVGTAIHQGTSYTIYEFGPPRTRSAGQILYQRE